MRGQEKNRVSGIGLIVLSLTALLDVLLLGYTQPLLSDEGTGAHIFQLSIVALLPTGFLFLFLTTADWAQPVLGKEICGKLLKRAPGYGFCCGGQDGETQR